MEAVEAQTRVTMMDDKGKQPASTPSDLFEVSITILEPSRIKTSSSHNKKIVEHYSINWYTMEIFLVCRSKKTKHYFNLTVNIKSISEGLIKSLHSTKPGPGDLWLMPETLALLVLSWEAAEEPWRQLSCSAWSLLHIVHRALQLLLTDTRARK